MSITLQLSRESVTMYRGFVVFCALLAIVRGQSTNINKCITVQGDRPLNTYVHGCVDPPCLLPQLQDVVIDVIFRAPHTVRNMTTLATAIVTFIIDITVNYDLGPNAITCNFFTNTFCPIMEGEVVQYRLKMFIESFFPVGTSATVEFRIVDNDRNGTAIWCIRLPIRILPPARGISDESEASPVDSNPIVVN